ncbi:MAG TPA: hypothetical protein VFC46_11430 [Humisphaera sp.]|nr:hypothetical protein [Humisphaera sp.]
MTDFRINSEANTAGTHNVGSIKLVPRSLVNRFGPPLEMDGFKVSGSFRFIDSADRVYTLYDWKATSLYIDGLVDGDESSLPTPKEFWGNEKPDEFQIGGTDDCDVKAFKEWLMVQVE